MTVAKLARERVKLPSLTAEVVIYFFIALMAVGLRLYRLDGRPMQAGEAAQALAAWRAAQGLPQSWALAQFSPILFTCNMFLFALVKANDFLARLVPALSGALLVVGPYFFRQRLGQMGALATSFFLALSSSTLFFSRYLGGDIVVTVCALAVAWGLFSYLDQRQPRYLYLGTAALGLALSAGAAIYTFILIVITFGLVLALINRFFDSGAYWERISDAWQAARQTSGLLRDCAALLILVFALICTSFLLNLSGLQDGIDLFSGWLSAFPPRVGGQPWYYHLQLLLVYEPLILVLGLMAVVYLLRQRDLFSLFLAYWAGAAILIYLVVGGRGPGDVLLIVLPLAMLGGALAGRLLDELAAEASWAREGLFMALACPVVAYLGLELGGYAFRSVRDHLWLALVAVLILVGMLVLYWFSYGREPAMRSGGLVLLLSLVVLTTSISCYLNYRRGSDPREIMLVSPTSRGILDLVETVELVSGRQGHPKAIHMTVHQGAGPASAWYLRDFEAVEFVTRLSPTVDTPVVIAPAEEQEPTLGAQYSGQDFALTSSWKPQGLSGPGLMRWLFYRRASTPVQTESLVLWVKQELPRVE